MPLVVGSCGIGLEVTGRRGCPGRRARVWMHGGGLLQVQVRRVGDGSGQELRVQVGRLSLGRKEASPDGSHHEYNGGQALGSEGQKCLSGDSSTRGTWE